MTIAKTQRAAEVPQPAGGLNFSLARLLNQEAYDTDPIKTDTDALKSYSGWIYACVSAIAQDVRSSPWSIWQRSGTSRKDWKKLEGSQIPEILMRPSATQTWGDLLELSQTHLDLSGRAFWHLVTAGTGGRVIGIQPLNPDWVNKPIYNADKTMLTGWEINVAGSKRRVLPADDVILFRYPDPMDPTGGISPVRAVAMSADMDTYSRAYAASHLRNHAQPTGILTTEAELTRDQAALLAEGWQDNHQGTSKIQVLGKGAQFQTLSAHIKDLEFAALAKVSMDQILAAYHIPKSRIGMIDDSSRANGEESDRVYSSLCLGPRLKRYEQPITYRLFPRIGLDPTRYSFEFDSVDVADKDFERIAAETAFGKGAITMDEYRDRIGFEPEAGGNGAVYFVPMGSTVTENPETGMAPMSVSGPAPAFEDVPTIAPDADAARGEAKVGESIAPETVLNGAQVTSLIQVVTAMMTGSLPYASALEIIQSAFGMSLEKAQRILGPESNAGINKPEVTAAAVDRALEAVEVETEIEADDRELSDPSDEQIEIAALRFLNSQSEGERRMKGRLRAVFTKMSKAVVSAAKGERSKGKGVETRASVTELEAVIDRFNDELATIIEEEAVSQFSAGHEAFSSEIAGKVAPELLIDFNMISDATKDWAKNHAAKEITKISDTTKRKVRRVLDESMEANESIDQLAKRLRDDFNKFKGIRAETIARTETAGSYNAGKFNNSEVFADENPDLDVMKTWVPTQDNRTREHHKAENIKNQTGDTKRTVLQNQPFLVKGEQMMRPLDPNGSAANVVRCRCVLIYDVEGD